MVKTTCMAVLLVALATSAQAGVIVSFAGDAANSGGNATLAEIDPPAPLVVPINIGLDGTPSLGSITTASANGNIYAAGFSVSGTATGGFGSTVTLTLKGWADTAVDDATPAARSILGRDAGGIGMRNGNSGRIDNGATTIQ